MAEENVNGVGQDTPVNTEITLKGGSKAIQVVYSNGHKVLKVTLSTGKEAVIREMTAGEMEQASRLSGNNETDAQFALAALATKIGGEYLLLEDFKAMKMKDYNRILECNYELNF